MPHPAQIRDAVQVYIEQQYHPVRTWHIQDEIANREQCLKPVDPPGRA